MKQKYKRIVWSLLLFMLASVFAACQAKVPLSQSSAVTDSTVTRVETSAGSTASAPQTQAAATKTDGSALASIKVKEDGRYSSKMEVAAYLYQYKKLPSNYITKAKAQKLGWVASKGNLWKVTDKMSIGGDVFGNFEKLLPVKKGRQYYEADIDYKGGTRGAKRIIYSNDGLIYYTEDHYASFEKLN